MRVGRHLGVVLVWLVGGCGDGGDSTPSYAKAFDNRPESQRQAKVEAPKVGMEDLRERAAKDAEVAREAELTAITTPPVPLPGDVETACTDAARAFDEFKIRRLQGQDAELSRWNATKEPDLLAFVDACSEAGHIEVGACMAHALREASPATFGEEAADEIVARCKQRYGGDELSARGPVP